MTRTLRASAVSLVAGFLTAVALGWLGPDPTGVGGWIVLLPLDGINAARRFRTLLVRAGLPRFPLYATRHTFAPHLLTMGAPITYAAAELGHAKPTMTLAAYAHSLPRGDRALAGRLEVWRAERVDPQVVPQVIDARDGLSGK